jgi:TonB family protein
MILKVKPVYPEEALEKEIQGNVKIRFTVNEKGEVVKAKALSGHQMLRKAALDAIVQSRFSNAFNKTIDAKMTYYFKILDDEEMISDSDAEQSETPGSAEEQGLKLIEKVEPDYPQEARDKGVEGEVILEVKIDENGEIIEVEVKDGPELLHAAAIAAVKKYRFSNPQRRSVTATIAIDFEL